MLATSAPIPQYFDLDGSPLDRGEIFFGLNNQNPETAPQTVYWDAAGTQPAAQPIKTMNGYTVRAGAVAPIYVGTDYSITVRNRRGKMVLYAASSAALSNDQALQNQLNRLPGVSNAADGAGMLGFSDDLAYGGGTTGRALQSFVDPMNAPYSAAGDGVADDTAALIAAEAAAYARGATLLLRAGKTFNFNGSFSTRVSISGSGATIKQTRLAVSTNNAFGLVVAAADNLVISGLTIDGNLKTSGFIADGRSFLTFRECYAKNCVNLAFGIYAGVRVDLWGCRSSNTRYSTVGVVGGAADGFYFGGCSRSRWIGCAADDFRRIGFVSEGNGATKSEQIQALFCLASNANNCDDSTTEYNAGFWAENTNSIDWLYCIASNIAGNAGQASGRVAGLWVLGGGNTSRGSVSAVGCRVFGGAGYLPNAMMVGGSATYADVLIENCYVNRCRTGISSGCGLNSLTIRNLIMEDIVTISGAQGGILIDAGGVNLLPVLEIDKVTATGAIWHADAGIVNFFSAPAACRYTLRNIKGGAPHVMRSSVARLRAEECEIACGAANFASFLGAYQEHIDPAYTSRNGANSDFITSGGALAAGSEVIFRGGTVTGFGAGWMPDFSGVNITTRCYGTEFSNFCWAFSTTGTFLNQFDHCRFPNVPPAIGAIRANFNVPTKQVLMVQNCFFESAAAADTPIRLWNTAPTNTVLQGNVRKTATNLHNLGAITSDVNNIAI